MAHLVTSRSQQKVSTVTCTHATKRRERQALGIPGLLSKIDVSKLGADWDEASSLAKFNRRAISTFLDK